MILPDHLPPDFLLVICDPAAGDALARAGHYYAGPSNRLWEHLILAGLTPVGLTPEDEGLRRCCD